PVDLDGVVTLVGQHDDAIADDDFDQTLVVDVRQRDLRVLPGVGVGARGALTDRDLGAGVNDGAAVVEDSHAAVVEGDHDFGNAIVVQVTGRQTAAGSHVGVGVRAIAGVDVVAFEPVFIPAEGEVVLASHFPAAMDRAHHTIFVGRITDVGDEQDFGEVELVDEAVVVVVGEVHDERRRDRLGRIRIRRIVGARIVGPFAAPLDFRIGQHLFEGHGRQRTGGGLAGALAGADVASRERGAIPVVFAAAA